MTVKWSSMREHTLAVNSYSRDVQESTTDRTELTASCNVQMHQKGTDEEYLKHTQTVVSLGGPPRVTPSGGREGDTCEKKFFVGKFTKNSGQTRLDR